MINMTIKEIYESLLAEEHTEHPNHEETVEEAITRIRPYVEGEIKSRFQKLNSKQVKLTEAKETATGKTCYPAVEVDFSNPYTWVLNLGIMAVEGKNIYSFHVIDSDPYDVFLIGGNILKKLDRESLDSFFFGEEKIPFTNQKEKKTVLFMFK